MPRDATEDLEIDVPPLQTRPKAALVGVGRHVILRPAVQKRYLELAEPSLEDQVSDLERVLAAVDDFELRVHPGRCALLGRTLRAADYKVTAVICDDLLIDVEPGDTTARTPRDRVRPGHDDGGREPARPGHRPAARRALDAEPPAALRRRRDLARLGDDARPRRARGAAGARGRDAEPARGRGVRGGGHRARAGLRDGRLRQRDHDPDRARDRPRAAGDGAVHRRRARGCRRSPRADYGVQLHPRAPAFTFPALGAYVGGDIVAGHARDRPHARPAGAALHRRRHELRDRARLAGAGRLDRRPRRPRLRGRPDPVRHARRRGRDRGRAGSRATTWRSR